MGKVMCKRNTCLVSILIMFIICLNCCFEITAMASELPVIQLETQVSDNEKEQDEGHSEGGNEKNGIPVIYIMFGIVTVLLLILVTINIIGLIKKRRIPRKEVRLDNRKKETATFKEVRYDGVETVEGSPKSAISNISEKSIIQIIDKRDYTVYKAEVDSSEKMREINVGRGEQRKVDIRIPIPTVSDIHCVIVKQYQQYYIKDSNSTNGTKYNGKKVEGLVELDKYGVLELGKSQFELRITDS